MIGVVLAAGVGSRLGHLTSRTPKSLLPVAGERTILECIARNYRDVGLTEAVVITGFAADVVVAAAPGLQRRTGLQLHLLHNDLFAGVNNAHSLWLARETFRQGVLLCNGDTLHPRAVQERLLAARGAQSPPLLLAVDDRKVLGDEEMKISRGPDGEVERINKALDHRSADGEYIGVAVIEPAAGDELADALEVTWRADPTLYYEDGFEEYLRRGGQVGTSSVGGMPWIEVDTPHDLERARAIADEVLHLGSRTFDPEHA